MKKVNENITCKTKNRWKHNICMPVEKWDVRMRRSTVFSAWVCELYNERLNCEGEESLISYPARVRECSLTFHGPNSTLLHVSNRSTRVRECSLTYHGPNSTLLHVSNRSTRVKECSLTFHGPNSTLLHAPKRHESQGV